MTLNAVSCCLQAWSVSPTAADLLGPSPRQPSPGFTGNGTNKRKHPVSGGYVEENALMSEVRLGKLGSNHREVVGTRHNVQPANQSRTPNTSEIEAVFTRCR